MEERSNDIQVHQAINQITFGKRSILRFLTIGWIIIGLFGLMVVGNPAILLIYLILALTDRIYYLIIKKDLVYFAKIGEFLSKLCFGAEHEQKGNIRIWWTFLVGFYIFDLIVVLFIFTSWLVVPVILLIAHRDSVLKGLYTVVFLPRNSKLVNPDWEEKKRKQALNKRGIA